jgi:hypothetical protein
MGIYQLKMARRLCAAPLPGCSGIIGRPARNDRSRREGDSHDAPPDGQFATAETGRAVEDKTRLSTGWP